MSQFIEPIDEPPLTEPSAAWLRLTSDSAQVESVTAAVIAAGGAVHTLPGRRMRTEDDLLTEFAQAMQFPDYFGNNADALYDCLSDLDWLPEVATRLVVITDAQEWLSAESPVVLSIYLRLLEDVCAVWSEPIALGEPWDRPAVAFHVIFEADSVCSQGSTARRWGAAAPGE